MDKNLKIIGIGNLILTDEGVGIHAVRELEKRGLPEWIEIIDGGTSTMELLDVIHGAVRIIFIDAVKGGGEPGTIYRITPDDLQEESEHPLSIHQVGILDVLDMVKQLGGNPDVVIIGVEPKEITWGMELSPEVNAKFPKLIEAVLKEIEASS
jgi:hydrogenase maturation protease